METKLDYLEIIIGKNPTASVIWMHGLGASGSDFESIPKELRLPADLSVRFIFPNAPVRPVTVNNGYAMRSWYDIYNLGEDNSFDKQDESGIRESQEAIIKLIEQEESRGIPSNKIIIAGFSQGGAMALQTGLRYKKALAGILVLSAYLPLEKTLEKEKTEININTPIMIAHGTIDNMVPIKMAEHARQYLSNLGYPVDWRIYRMAHTMCLEEIQHIREWIQARFYTPI